MPDAAVYEVWLKLNELDLGGPGFDTIQDVVSCPGTDSCKLGITASMGVNKAVHDRIAELNITDPLTKQIDIRMSGCPNGCSQHHIASIGFNGAAMKFNGKTVPAYIVQIGGRGKGRWPTSEQRLKMRIPAKRVPEAVERWLALYEIDRNEGEEPFADFVERVGTTPFEDVARDLTLPVEFSEETEDMFVDWQRQGLFEVDPRRGRVRHMRPQRTQSPDGATLTKSQKSTPSSSTRAELTDPVQPPGRHRPRQRPKTSCATPSISFIRASTWRLRSRRKPR